MSVSLGEREIVGEHEPKGKCFHSLFDCHIIYILLTELALRMGYSEIGFRIARVRASQESLQWSLYDLSIYVQILNVNC